MRPRKKIAVYARPKCCTDSNWCPYKGYFNVGWFVRAYSAILFDEYQVITTGETKTGIMSVAEDLAERWGLGRRAS